MTLRTRACDVFGTEVPIVQTGMGWVAGARLVTATANAGALGILASATMTYDQLADAIREVKDRTDRPFGVNLRADAEDADARVALLIREQVKVASFALAPKEAQIKQLKDAGSRRRAEHRRAPARRKGCGLGRRRRHRPRWRRRRAYRLGRDLAATPPGRRRGRDPGHRRGRFL